jgi:hypothetical protein
MVMMEREEKKGNMRGGFEMRKVGGLWWMYCV